MSEERLRKIFNMSDTEVELYAKAGKGEIPIRETKISYTNIWELFAQQEEVSPETVKDYEDRKKISDACTVILRLFKEKGLLDEEIIEGYETGWDGRNPFALTIQELLTEIIDEYMKGDCE